MDVARFVRSTIEGGNSAFIKKQVQSDIASIQKIWKVRLFYILGEAGEAATGDDQVRQPNRRQLAAKGYRYSRIDSGTQQS